VDHAALNCTDTEEPLRLPLDQLLETQICEARWPRSTRPADYKRLRHWLVFVQPGAAASTPGAHSKTHGGIVTALDTAGLC
jgi:hypothetical protein